jgi:hypothetical protein
MANVRLIKHEAVPDCGSYEVRIESRRSRFSYREDRPSRCLQSGQLIGAQALELARSLARGLSISRRWAIADQMS